MRKVLKEGGSEKNLPLLLLFAAGMIDFLWITLEGQFSFVGYYLAKTYLIVPCLLFLGYMLRGKVTAFAGRRLLLAAAAVSWFVVVQIVHQMTDMEPHPIATVFFVYLMGFPFASLTEDRDSAGIRLIGKLFVAASLVLVGYGAMLFFDWVPEGLKTFIYWDGARLRALWHPNLMAFYLMIGIGFSASFCVRTEKPLLKALLLAVIGVQYLVMTLTNCRTVLLLTGCLLGGIAFFRIFRGGWKRFVLGLLTAVMLLAGSFSLSGVIYRWNNDRLLADMIMAQTEPAAVETVVTEPVVQTMPPETTAEVATAEAIPEEIPAEPVEEIPAEPVEEMPAEPAEEMPAEPVEEISAELVDDMPAEETVPMNDGGILVGESAQGTLSSDMRTLNGRTMIWKSALNAVQDNRKLALWGTPYSGTVISVYNPFVVHHAHNSWMEVLLRLGLPGLMLSLVFTAMSLWSAAGLLLRKETELWKKIVAMITLCILGAGFLEPYLFITDVYYHVMDFLFFFCTGYLDYWCNHKETA